MDRRQAGETGSGLSCSRGSSAETQEVFPMKATDFRPEHFEKGRSFSRSDFNAYVQASGAAAFFLISKSS